MGKEEKVVYTACQGWGCHEHCILTTYVFDGQIDRTERTIVRGSKAERGGICQKGIIAGKYPYIPERLLHPLKRVGKRGEGKFERISWDQALDEIGTKLNQISEKYGRRSIIVNSFPCGIPLTFGALSNQLCLRFIHTSDCSRMHLPNVDQSYTYPFGIEYGDMVYSSLIDPDIMRDSNFIIIWGGNPIGFTRAAHTTRTLIEAQERGAKLVDVGLIYDSSAAKADQFIAVNPGTDAPMAMAMANLIIQENRYDEDALSRFTVAPLLIREDTGKFLHWGDIASDGNPTAYVFWDKTDDQTAAIEPHVFEFGTGNPDLSVSKIINGIYCKTAFVKLQEHLAPWTPESQETITGVPAQTVIQLTHEYLDNGPATIFMNLGFRYANATHTVRCINLLPMLTGNFTRKGGRVISCPLSDGHGVSLNEPAIMWPDGVENAKGECVQLFEILDSINQPDKQQYKAYINPYQNPIHCWPNPKVMGEQFLANMELVVVFEFRETDTNPWADYVLPECTPFEREELIAPSANCIVIQEPAIEPLGESKSPAFIWRELATRFGLGRYFDGMDTEDWNRLRLSSNDMKFVEAQSDESVLAQRGVPQGDAALAGTQTGLSYDKLKEQKIIQLNVTEDDDVYSLTPMFFGTPSGRIEFYCDNLTEVGAAMGKYLPPRIQGVERDKYSLQLYPGRHRVFMQSQFNEFPELRAIGGQKSSLSLNPVEAQKREIKEGDLVEVFNSRGTVLASASISEAFPPGMAHLWYAYPKKDHIADPPTVLSTTLSSHETEDDFTVAWGKQWLKQNVELGVPPVLVFQNGAAGTFETLWDDLCEVRKVKEA